MYFNDMDYFRKLFAYIDSTEFDPKQEDSRFRFWTSDGEQTPRERCTNMTFYSEGIYGGFIDIFPERITICYDDYNDIEDKSQNKIHRMDIDTTPFVHVSEEEIFQQSTAQNFDFLEDNPDVLKQILMYSLEVHTNRRKLDDSWS